MKTRAVTAYFGGTFNPVHFGHLRMAVELQQRLPVERVYLVPARTPPLKHNLHVTAEHRLAMLSLAVENVPQVAIDSREMQREGPSFTVDTLADVRREVGPDHSIAWVMGMDAFLSLHRWHRWEAILDLAHIVVLSRPGVALSSTHPMRGFWQAHIAEPDVLQSRANGHVIACPLSQLAISSTAIRHAIAQNHSPQFLLPDSVLSYIRSEGLYRDVAKTVGV